MFFVIFICYVISVNQFCIMTVQKKIKSHPDVKNYFKKLPLYNTYIEKPNITKVKNIDLFSELPCYEELIKIVIKISQAFKRYAMSCKVELVEKKDPLIQLELSKSSIKACLMVF